MKRVAIAMLAVLFVVTMGCCKKYETALADLDASVVVVNDSLVQTMEMANKAAKAAGEEAPLYDDKDRDARIRTCWEMRALIWTTLLGEKVEYTLPAKDAEGKVVPGVLFYMKGEERVPVQGNAKPADGE